VFEGQLINNAIEKALKEADKMGIKGKDVTPFILSAVAKITSGRSLITSKFLRGLEAHHINRKVLCEKALFML
jgi:pseudouridine-5'-phosphate glycosidase